LRRENASRLSETPRGPGETEAVLELRALIANNDLGEYWTTTSTRNVEQERDRVHRAPYAHD
jgi:hypothetical protein